MSDVSELFEKISHPTRVKILKLLDDSPLSFSQLKNKLDIE
ncbi:MAG: ArsR family transcriptional regulator [Candidatus Bathyarchaeia archaeon]